MIKRLAAIAALTVCISTPANAVGYYLGAKFGWMDADIGGLDSAINIGGLFGLETINNDMRYGAELEVTGTASDGDVSAGPLDGNWDITTYAIYGVFKYGAVAYFKAKLGYLYEDVSIDVAGFSADGDDSGLSGGVGVGYRFSEQIALEGEVTIVEEDINFYSIGLNYSF